jgi:hypothetical protein
MKKNGNRVIFKSIPGYEEFYKISNTGIVVSKPRTITRKSSNKYSNRVISLTYKSRILKTQFNKFGYESVSLRKDGVAKTIFIHRLVLLTFLGPVPKDHVVNHRDFNRANNNLENLEYVTMRKNTLHSVKAGRINLNVGRKMMRRKSKLNGKDVKDIRASHMGVMELSRKYGLSHTQIRRILNKENWANV